MNQEINSITENKGVLERKISKRRMSLKSLRLFLWTIRKRRWYLPEISEINADLLVESLDSNLPPLLIDVLGETDFKGNGQYKYEKYGHIPNSKSIPLMELSSNFDNLQTFQEKEIVTICQGGGASLVAVDILVEADFKNVKSLKGGIKE